MADTPQFVTDYVTFLTTLQRTQPDTFNSLYGISDASNVSLVPSQQPSTGWVVSSVDNTTGTVLSSVSIQPAFDSSNSGFRATPPPASDLNPGDVTLPPVIPIGIPTSNTSGSTPQGFVSASSGVTSPYQPPANSFAAQSISDMLSYSPSNDDRTFIYDVGVPTQVQPITYTLRNNTIANPLQIQFTRPSFTQINMPSIISLAPQQQINVTISLLESVAKKFSVQTQRTFLEEFTWTVTPMNIDGPIYIQSGLAPVSGQSIPAVQETTSISTVDTTDAAFTTIFFSLKPLISNLVAGEHSTVELDAWIGNSSVTPNADGAILLQFGLNSVHWTTQKTTILDIDNLNGTGIVSIVGLVPGTADLTVSILQPPKNVSTDKWNQILNSSSITGDGQLSAGTISIVGAVTVG